MRRLAVFLMLSMLLFAGCAKKGDTYSINSISLEGTKHMLGQRYSAYISLSEDALNSSMRLSLQDNGEETDSITLNDSAPIENGKALLAWDVHEDGPHNLDVNLYSNETVAASKSMPITASPLGLKEEDFPEVEFWYDPVEKALWQAQAFDLETSIQLRKAGVYLKYIVAPPENSNITIELRNGTTDGTLIAEATLPSRSLDTEFEWHFVSFPSLQLEAGRYWLVLKRTESQGTVVWSRGPGNLIGKTDDTMVLDNTQGQEGSWRQKDMDFTFQISSQD